VCKSDELHVCFETNLGRDGEDIDTSNPIARAMDRLLRDGKPIQKLGLCFARLLNPADGQFVSRWLGVFVYSAGERLIFFPGYTTPPSGVRTYRGQNQTAAADVTIDHLSLEKNGADWHMTSPRSEDHFGGPTSLPLCDGSSLWFGMSLAGDAVLRPVMNRTVVRVDVPASDAERRIQVLHRAREAVEFPLVQLNPLAYQLDQPYFLHFSVIIGPVGFPHYTGAELGYPVNSPFLATPLPPALSPLPVAAYRLSLAPYCDVQLIATTLPGRLSVPIAFTAPPEPQTA
jgi:hypothetical protein